MSDPKKSRGKNLSEDDAALFDAAMRDVEKIKPRQTISTEKPKPAPAAKAPVKKTVVRPVKPSDPPSRKFSELQAGHTGDADTRTMERLRRGRMRPEARLDLHGMTQDEAHRALNSFLPAQRQAGRRCILVITGKGRVSEGGGVLRNQFPNWINSASLRSHVIGFAEAQPRDGGAGAAYVLLRRLRQKN